jgi:hypothetical protein
MSSNHRLPIDESVLNAFWNEVVSGSETDLTLTGQLPADVVQALRLITAIDPAPQSSTVRERAWAETWERIRTTSTEQEPSIMHAIPLPSNPSTPTVVPLPGATPRRRPRFSNRAERRWHVAAVLIAAVLVALAIVRLFGPFGPDPVLGPVIPAVVVTDATPEPAGAQLFRIELPSSSVVTTGSVSSGLDYVVVPANEHLYRYRPYCCSGPFLEYVLAGQIAIQSGQPMTVIRADGAEETIAVDTEVILTTGDTFVAENDGDLDMRNTGASDTHLLGWVLTGDPRFQGHAAAGFPETMAVDLEFDMQVSPGPATLVLARYDDAADVPPPAAPNSYQFVLYMDTNQQGTPVLSDVEAPLQGTPASQTGGAAVFVLDFLMSPPGAASPAAGTPSAEPNNS